MRKQLTFIFISLLGLSTALADSGDRGKTSFEVDTEASKVHWTGKKVTGEHTGHLKIQEGVVHVDGNKVIEASLSMDMNSIECTDLSGEWKDKLIGHLKSDDFFSVEKYPNAMFKIKSVKNSGSEQVVVGDLTIKGITNEVTFPANVAVEGETLTASGTASIDRTLYDIKFRSAKFFSDLGDTMISDKFEIKFELKAKLNDKTVME
jgi:polyisoprenoid-binding protein YceI